MTRQSRTVAMACEPEFQPRSSRLIAVAAEAALAERIKHALTSARYEFAGPWADLPELIEDLPSLGAQAAVAAVDPVRDRSALALLRSRIPRVPLIAVVPSLRGLEAGRLVSADLDGLVLAGEIESALGPVVASVLADQLCVPSAARPTLAGPVFSHREKQVLDLLVAGLTNADIAGQLYLSESTVKSHLSSSFRKLGVSSRAEVLRRAGSWDAGLGTRTSVDRSPGTPSAVAALAGSGATGRGAY